MMSLKAISSPPTTCAAAPAPTGKAHAYSLLEVMMAAVILAFVLMTSIVIIQVAVRDMDTARLSNASSQAMQNEMERIRLLNWTEISDLPNSETVELSSTFTNTNFAKGRITLTRTVTDASGFANMKEIRITASWVSIDGIAQQRSVMMRYAKNGLYDYYYGSSSS